MKYLLTTFLIYLQFTDLTWADASEPYCVYNKTEYTLIKVNKTREVNVHKPWYKKLSKTITKLEYYEDEEPVPKVTPIRDCCKGYKMSKLRLCEPQCSEGCPENSKCVEPEICKCMRGYFSSYSEHDRKSYCQPMCDKACPQHSVCVKPNECACRTGYHVAEGSACKPHCPSGCPFNGECVAPNQCECRDGYRSEKGSCLPICSLGDQCKNGVCLDKEKCQCNFGFYLNGVTQKCEPNLAIFRESETATPMGDEMETPESDEDWQETTEHDAQPDFGLEIETDIDTSQEDVDPSQVFDETFESTTWQSLSTDWQDVSNKCPDDFVLYRGRCQPLKFAIDEIDCRIQECADPQAVCSEEGICVCSEGYKMLKKAMQSEDKGSSQHVVKPVCLTLAEYQNLMVLPAEERNTKQPNAEESSNIMAIVFIALGVVAITASLVYLGLRLVRAQTGQLDVEGKQLSCAYENRGCSDTEKSAI